MGRMEDEDARIQFATESTAGHSGWLPGTLGWATVHHGDGRPDDPDVLYELWIHVDGPIPTIDGKPYHQIRVKVDRRDYGKSSGIGVPSSVENMP